MFTFMFFHDGFTVLALHVQVVDGWVRVFLSPCMFEICPPSENLPFKFTIHCMRPDKISAQSLFNIRPDSPSAPPASKAQTDTPGTGVLSSDSHSAAHNKDDEQQQPSEQQDAQDDTSTEESSPASSRKESPETQTTDATGASSPEPVSESKQDDDLDNADISMLQKIEKRACEKVASYETRLSNAREQLSRIRKRLKRMSDDRSSDYNPLLVQTWKWKSLIDEADS